MEVFNRMISATTHQGSLSGFVVGSRPFETVNISHLLFEDDTSVFCGANVDHIFSQKALLVWFEAISGLKVNMTKSALVLVGNVDNAVELVGTLGYVTYSLPLKYHGLPKPLGLISRPRQYGTTLWKKLSVGWLVGKQCICLKVGGLPLSKALFLTYLRTSCLFSPSPPQW
jgi:hypothetical protein